MENRLANEALRIGKKAESQRICARGVECTALNHSLPVLSFQRGHGCGFPGHCAARAHGPQPFGQACAYAALIGENQPISGQILTLLR
ncbi:MAG TPA: hypothetical protein VN792_00710, partial [Candidatus Acidoferrales bacterium]|nr:hypothetical protein [Candidatus Acidoferrales bacterium]